MSSEAALERKVVDAAWRIYGVKSVKLNGPGTRGWPDREFLIPGGRPVFIEFKSKKGRLSARQKVCIEHLSEQGYPVMICVDYDAAMQFIRYSISEDKL